MTSFASRPAPLSLGEPIEHWRLFAALLPVRERVLGPEHPDTLATRHNLAYWTKKASRRFGEITRIRYEEVSTV